MTAAVFGLILAAALVCLLIALACGRDNMRRGLATLDDTTKDGE